MDLLDDDDDEPEAPRGSASASASGEVAEKKQRFVWTPDLHCRFEAAVHKLGVAHAKPQAIRRLMGCDGEENAPTRQNIKSHLQKYRLFFSKRLGRRGAKGGGGDDDDGEPSPLDPYLERQHNGLLAQLELHAKLHTQLLIQRSTQAALSLRMSHSQGRPALHPLQLQRLARHVLMQRNMLQHLVALLHSSTVEILAERGLPKPARIVSGLPFASLPEAVQDAVVDGLVWALEASACDFRTFQYAHAYGMKAARRFRALMDERFERFERIGPIVRNVPPAFVLRYSGVRG